MPIWLVLIVVGMLVCTIQAVRSQRLLICALWLAGCSALVALLLYLVGAPEIAVIELSVGAGLVTVLFVFAINIAGEDAMMVRSLIPRPFAWGLVGVAVFLLGWLILPGFMANVGTGPQPDFPQVLWQDRSLDLLLQIILIFAGVLGAIGLLAEGQPQPASKG